MGGRGGSARSSAEGPTATQTSAQPATGSDAVESFANQIRALYSELASRPGEWVSLTDVRERLGAEAYDTYARDALRRMIRQPGVFMATESNQKALRPADRAAQVNIGGEPILIFNIQSRGSN